MYSRTRSISKANASLRAVKRGPHERLLPPVFRGIAQLPPAPGVDLHDTVKRLLLILVRYAGILEKRYLFHLAKLVSLCHSVRDFLEPGLRALGEASLPREASAH